MSRRSHVATAARSTGMNSTMTAWTYALISSAFMAGRSGCARPAGGVQPVLCTTNGWGRSAHMNQSSLVGSDHSCGAEVAGSCHGSAGWAARTHTPFVNGLTTTAPSPSGSGVGGP